MKASWRSRRRTRCDLLWTGSSRNTGVQPRILVETPYGVTIAILAAQGLGTGLVNPFIIADKMIRGIVVRPFEPAVHFRALLLKPPGSANSRLVSAFAAELFAVRNALLSVMKLHLPWRAQGPPLPAQRNMRRIRLLASSIRMTKTTTTKVSVATF